MGEPPAREDLAAIVAGYLAGEFCELRNAASGTAAPRSHMHKSFPLYFLSVLPGTGSAVEGVVDFYLDAKTEAVSVCVGLQCNRVADIADGLSSGVWVAMCPRPLNMHAAG